CRGTATKENEWRAFRIRRNQQDFIRRACPLKQFATFGIFVVVSFGSNGATSYTEFTLRIGFICGCAELPSPAHPMMKSSPFLNLLLILLFAIENLSNDMLPLYPLITTFVKNV
ncbi:MAG: hypothetical protein J6T00_06990, partial [Bacteroidaceae bacterium]|nr:hypothetical protein [Bacteroidaceae bacterium]